MPKFNLNEFKDAFSQKLQALRGNKPKFIRDKITENFLFAVENGATFEQILDFQTLLGPLQSSPVNTGMFANDILYIKFKYAYQVTLAALAYHNPNSKDPRHKPYRFFHNEFSADMFNDFSDLWSKLIENRQQQLANDIVTSATADGLGKEELSKIKRNIDTLSNIHEAYSDFASELEFSLTNNPTNNNSAASSSSCHPCNIL